jgi:hypothetical protein
MIGDRLAVLGELAKRPGFDEVITDAAAVKAAPRAAVVGLDLRAVSSGREAARQLKQLLPLVELTVGRCSTLDHVCVAYNAASEDVADRLDSVAESVASRLHAGFERRSGRYVDVTVVDVSGCDDAVILANRLEERINEVAGHHADIAVRWTDIAHRSIRQVTLDRYT